MFSVTLVNLTPDASAAVEGQPPVDLGTLKPAEFDSLLRTFTAIDPVQNLKLDPEIRVSTRRERFVIRTGQGKLFLYDTRRMSDPAFVCSPSEAIAEIDGSAVAQRTAAPFSMSPFAGGDPAAVESATLASAAPPPAVESRRTSWVLLAVTLLLSAYVVSVEVGTRGESGAPTLSPLSDSERQTEDAALTGVYMTGSQPGQHGIVILGDGDLKLFTANTNAAPSVVYGKYKLGRLDSKLCLATDQPGGIIRVTDGRALEYSGEKYDRLP
jgi:hypothetical protein